jgi:hypothetical protein
MPIQFGPVLAPELQERLLNDVPSLFFVADDPLRVPQEVPLVFQEDLPQPLGRNRMTVVHPGLYP